MSTNLDAAGAALALRRRRLTRRTVVRFAAPYALIAPAIVVIGAILAYPLYYLVRLSFQRYGLFQLIAHKGSWVGLHNYGLLLHDSVFWHTLVRTVIFTAVNVALTMVLGTLVALFLRVSPGKLFGELGNPVVVDALVVSVKTSAIAHGLVLAVGTPAAYLIARHRFRGRGLVLSLIELPLVLPPAVAGIALLAVFGRLGLLGGTLSALGITISFTQTAVVLAAALERGHNALADVRGLTWRDGDSIRTNPSRPPIADLDRYRPAWELVDWDAYQLFGFGRAAGIQFSRGCTLACTYCGQWNFWRRWRHRSPQHFVDQLELLAHGYGVRIVWFADENFAAGDGRIAVGLRTDLGDPLQVLRFRGVVFFGFVVFRSGTPVAARRWHLLPRVGLGGRGRVRRRRGGGDPRAEDGGGRALRRPDARRRRWRTERTEPEGTASG